MVEYKELFDEKVYIIKAEEELLTLNNGYTITSEHYADCCEYNYIDFSAVYDTILMHGFNYLHIETKKGLLGIRINQEFIPAYSLQNGYYTDLVGLIIRDSEGEVVLRVNQNIECEVR